MLRKQRLKHAEDVRIEPRRLRKSFRARMRIKACVANSQSERARRKPSFAKPFACFLRKMAEKRVQRFVVVRILSKRMIVRNGFWLGINHKFVGIAAARLAVKRVAPSAKNLFEFFRRNRSELLHGLDAERLWCALSDFANARNLAHRQRRKKPRFLPGRNPN